MHFPSVVSLGTALAHATGDRQAHGLGLAALARRESRAMTCSRATVLLVAFMIAGSADLLAQHRRPIVPGDRVRISAPGIGVERLVATVLTVKPDTIVVRNGEPLALPFASVTKLEVSRDRKSRARLGMAIGFWSGAVAGGVIAARSLGDTEDTYWGGNLNLSDGTLFGGALFGGIAGTLVGALIGSTFKVDQWEAVPLHRIRVTIVPQRKGKLSVGVSLRL